MILRKSEKKDLERILELNEESVHFLSPMTMEKLEHLSGQSEMISVIEVDGIVEAFSLTIREGKDYDSVNYMWFSEQYNHFLYIDRVVVSVKMHGKGLGRMLYQALFEHAKQIEVPYITAEIDINPPNPGSLMFHKKFGFKEVGKQSILDGKKVVSLQVVEI
ncbi:GNAT family N-acetyltransferase [Alkaliphilus pronyensis]|uniref:GNAT family N-acetyltransferase n=1 Tax=Alkaliphilus pronyensis TaxID=1482732 RepID=A0A6I0EXS5_9FIRM|nr:GNAT family N-acetyltransferase [Alkaliphilus pronyensis]KAB3534071.1 GNAT family N-acetyltransferase [Alkaliphilus pronyensis]